MDKPYEIRLDDAGKLDEVCSGSVRFFHLEQMSDQCWWMRLDLNDGSAVVVNLYTKRAEIMGMAELEQKPRPGPPTPTPGDTK